MSKDAKKPLWTRLKAVCAVVLSTVLVAGAATVLSAPEPAEAAAGPFTCTSDFYQVSAGKMYQYSVSTNTYSVMPASLNVASLNGIAYNTGDNYIYGVVSGKLYQIANDGSQVSATTITGTSQNTGADFIAANKLLGVSNAGVWSLTDTTTHTAAPFTATGTTWAAYDLAFNPTNHTIYGMDGTKVYIGVVTGTTSVAITSKTVTGSLAGTGDSWGAAYVDSAGDAYFFDNTTHDLVEISAANLATATPAATSITQANSLATPNDGASCPTASSPLAPTVATTAATSITTTTAALNGTVATGLPVGSDVPSGGIVICYSTSATVSSGALSVSPVCAAATPSSLALNTAATAVTRSVSGLTAGTTYYVQVQATNSFGLAAYANVVSFTTVAASHTVTFSNNGGTGTIANEVNNAATALTTNTFTRAGYTFSGWNTAANGSGTAYADGASYPFTADATMYAQWTAVNHTVTFSTNGGTGTMANEVNNAATALTTNTFTRAGYTFSGWNTAANGTGTAYANGASYPFTADATMYAQWTAVNHTVIFDNNGGTGTMANEVNNAATALTTNSFTRAGYTFSGWNTAANGTGTAYANGASYPFTADATLYAQWTIANHTVIFDNNGGTGSMANEVHNLPTALTTNTFTRPGYTFSGWATTSGGTVAYADGVSFPFTADATLYAVWTIANHTVTFDNNGGTGSMANEVHNLPTALTTSTFTRAGYTFSGWNTAANGTGTAYADSASFPFTADATMYAVWTIANHTVIFDNNGGTGSMANEVHNLPTALTTNTFTRAGYTFSGWNTAANGTGTAYADSASFPFTADATMYAVWTAVNHTVTFDNNGGTGTMANEVNNAATALTTNTFTRVGYTFSGWNTAANGTGTAYANGASYPFTADATMYAQWTAVNHTVTFDNNGGTGSMANEVHNLPTALTTSTFTRAGYTFSGWATSSGGTVVYADSASFPFTADATLFAVWTIANHTVIFDNNGGTGSMANEVHNLPTALTTNTFTRAGYTFSGWATSSGGTVVYADSASFPFTADATLFAVWTIANHTVIFDNNGGTGSMADEVHNLPTALTTSTFTRPGYTFSGWATTSGGTVAYADGASFPFTADATLFAVWAIANHTVTFDNNSGTGTMADEVHNLPTALTTDTFTRAGYTFSGWATTSGGTVAYADGASFPFTADATLYAVWTIANHTVIFDNNGGTGSMADEVHNLPTALTTSTFTRAGYTFSGWATSSGGTVAYADGVSFPFTADATLYAVWTIANHTVTFDNNGGTGSMANEVHNLPTALTTSTFTRAGYTFSGWNTAANGTGTAYADSASFPFTADATMYAVWTIANHTVIFDNNGGTGSMADEVHNLPTALTSNAFTRAGYTFSGWATTSGGTVAYADGVSFPFTADATLYAVWTIANHTVIFDNNGGTGSMANEVHNLPTALTTSTFTRAGYTFSGWATTSGGTVAYADGASFPFTADATMYAVWTIANHTVTFDNNSGTGTMADEVHNLPTALTTDTFTRVGYTFSGWNTAANGTGTAYSDSASFPFTADATLFAQWTALPNHTVTFDENGGTGTMADQVDNIATPLDIDTFTRFGYTFAGWNTAANGTGTGYADLASYPFTADGTLFAQWTPLPDHTVSFDPTSGSGVMADQVDNVPAPLTTDTFSRVGYSFVGWATTSGGAVAYVDAASYPFNSDATLYAVWSALPMHTVKFMKNGGSGVMGDEVDSVFSPLNPNAFFRTGYVFTGWNTAPDGSGTGYVDAESFDFSSDGVLYAQYSRIALAATGVDPSPAFELAVWFIAIGATTMLTIALIGRRRRAIVTQK